MDSVISETGGHLKVHGEHNTQLGHPHRRASRVNDTQLPHRRLSYAPGGNRRRSSVATSSSYVAGSSIARSSSRVHSPPAGTAKINNTYRFYDQFGGDHFDSGRVERALHTILKSFLDGEEYEKKRATLLTENITNVIRTKIKDMKFNRYKIVCNLLITQNSGQSIHFDSRCLWTKESDSFADAEFQNKSLYAIATVHGVYFE